VGDVIEFGLLLLGFGALAFLFGRNVYKGAKTGAVWNKSQLYHREEQPILFWISVGLSAFLTLFVVAGMGLVSYLLVTS